MAQLPDVGKLRQVLDYWSCESCLEQFDPQQDYLCGVCAKLNREVTVKRTAMGRDEAVQVIPPEDFHMARGLRDRIQQQELELQESRARLEKLQKREGDLMSRLEELQKQLEDTKKEKEAATLVPFELVGVKEGAPDEEIFEFTEEPAEPAAPAPAPAAAEWEEVPETEPLPDEEPQAAAPEPATFAAEEPADAVAAPTPAATADRRVKATDDAIQRIEAEISKIEAELTELATQEKELQKKGRTSGAKSTRKNR